MIGSADTKLPIGSKPRLRNGERSTAIATRKPDPQPTAKPVSTALKVWTKSASRIERESINRSQIWLGAGNSTVGTFAPWVTISQMSNSASPNMIGISMLKAPAGTC